MDNFQHKLLKNPRVGANFLSVAFFTWVWPLFLKGTRKQLDVEDLYEPLQEDKSERLGDKLEDAWIRAREKAQRKGGSASLLRVLCSMFWKQFLAVGLMDAVSNVGLRLVQPLLLGQLLTFFSPGSTMPKEHAFGFAGGIILCSLLQAVISNNNFHRYLHIGMQMRVACCSLIFRKATRLSRTALGDKASGQVVNLLSNDVSRFDIMSLFLNHLWLSPLLTVIIAYMLYSQVGWAGFVGIGTVFVVVPLQSYFGGLSSKFRHKIAVRTDVRVRLMEEIVSGVQVIKMYAWEKPFTKLISEARRKEMTEILKVYMVRGVFMTFIMFTTRVALFSTLITYALSGSPLKASFVFVIQSYYNVLSMTMGSFFVRGISEVAECTVSIRRLQSFLECEEFDAQDGQVQGGRDNPTFQGDRGTTTTKSTANRATKPGPLPVPVASPGAQANGKPSPIQDASTASPGDDTVLRFVNLDAKWSPKSSDVTLKNINLTLKKGQLLGVIGPVGGGKSSLLQAVLGELATTSGSLSVAGRVSYACQEPWLFAATIRQNITFGSAFERKRYDAVVRACALLADFDQLPGGDLTPVGERGSALSGGQRARVNLARAIYREADVYLLDDPLSAVDTHVGKHLFEECIVKYLSGKTRILVTHQVQYLADVSQIAILHNGEIQMQGSFNELLSSDVDYAKMLHLAEEDDDSEDEVDDGDSSLSAEENKRPLMRALRQLSRVSLRSTDEQRSRKLSRMSSRRSSTTSARSARSSIASAEDEEEEEHRKELLEVSTKGKVKGSLLFRYFLAGTNTFGLLVVIFLFLAAQAAGSCADFFVGFWTNQEEMRSYKASSTTAEPNTSLEPLTSTINFVYIYSGIIVSIFIFGFTRSFYFYWVCSRCSQALHDNMFKNIIQATMHFFNTNPSGRILNRFSKDLGSVDELLPKALLDASQFILGFFGYIAVAVSVDWMFLIPVIVLICLFGLLRSIYLKSAKNIKRLEGMTRSPVFTHLNATIQGLSTIRAFKAEDLVRSEFDNHQNLHSAAWYMGIFTSNSYGISLDLLSLCFVFLVVFSFLLLPQAVYGGDVGLAITQSMAMAGMIQFGMRQSAEVASQLLSVERVLEYTDLSTEDQVNKPRGLIPKPSWPSEGRVEFKKVWMRYIPEGAPVLKGLTFTINPMEKIGVVGRTGAGKSSLISALFRLAYLEGSVLLDGVDTGDISLQLLRSRISIIPQDPVLFSGTLRRNLDPFNEYKDDQLWAVLEDVELRDVASEAEGLEMRVADAGANFSLGQRQLICLARAILRGNKLLMLDEATANVDPQTDALIQKTIRTKFARCTVLTVAHRLNTIMDSDRVLVMDAGRVAEFDHPHRLIQKRGIFYSLVQETGHAMAENLMRAAKEIYENKITAPY